MLVVVILREQLVEDLSLDAHAGKVGVVLLGAAGVD